MENENRKGLTEFHCPDCWTLIQLEMGSNPSPSFMEMASKVRCEPCGGMRVSYGTASDVARKALHNSEVLGKQIEQLTKDGEHNLTIGQKEDLWKLTEKLQANMEAYRQKLSKMRDTAARFKLRTGMRIK